MRLSKQDQSTLDRIKRICHSIGPEQNYDLFLKQVDVAIAAIGLKALRMIWPEMVLWIFEDSSYGVLQFYPDEWNLLSTLSAFHAHIGGSNISIEQWKILADKAAKSAELAKNRINDPLLEDAEQTERAKTSEEELLDEVCKPSFIARETAFIASYVATSMTPDKPEGVDANGIGSPYIEYALFSHSTLFPLAEPDATHKQREKFWQLIQSKGFVR